jgi:(E)-4-hydroxy-3-methyl-but-2-enyl pyrophosphate reductase
MERKISIVNAHLAHSIGFCSGVHKAVETARMLLEQGEQVCVTGELVHNPSVMRSLVALGLQILNSDHLEDLTGKTVLVRAHGVSPSVFADLQKRAARLVDLTCPIVKQLFRQAQSLRNLTYDVFVLGTSHHPEMQALMGYAPGIRVIESLEALQAHWKLKDLNQSLALLSQTTVSELDFRSVVLWMIQSLKPFQSLQVVNTICPISRDRQKEVQKMARELDGVIVVGGMNSSNTRKLVDIARAYLEEPIHIEHPEEIRVHCKRMKPNASYGIISGTSTPVQDVRMTQEIILRNTGG